MDLNQTRTVLVLPGDWDQHPQDQILSTYDYAAWQQIIKEAIGAGAELTQLSEGIHCLYCSDGFACKGYLGSSRR